MRFGSLAIGLLEGVVGLGYLYVAFQRHNLLEGPLTSWGGLVAGAALFGFLFVHDALHRIPRSLKSPASDSLDDYFVGAEGD